MMLVGLGTALWGASCFPHASAFASPAILSSAASNAFVSRRSAVGTSATAAAPRRRRQHQHNNAGSSSSGGTVMLFDFIKKRAQEGVEQTQILVTAAQTGRLDEALKETSAYVKDRRVSQSSLPSMCGGSGCCVSRVSLVDSMLHFPVLLLVGTATGTTLCVGPVSSVKEETFAGCVYFNFHGRL